MKKFLPYILLILLILPAGRYLLGQGYFNMHDDLQVMRVFQMEKCFNDGQIPCRWAPDMEWGYGQAMFNFYSAFPYYLGQLIRVVTPLSLMATVKALFLISLVASGIGMYLLGKEFWGKMGGFLSAILYVYAPYHSLDIYIRGAMSESFSLAVLPFLWLFIYKLIKDGGKLNFLLLALSVFIVTTTHNVSMLIYLPVTLIWTVYWLLRQKNKKKIYELGKSGLLGVGLGSFFFLPVAFEQKLVQTKYFTMDYLNFEAHFVTLRQLFINRNWGHGPSIFGPYDDISFAIGWPHWFLIIPIFIFAAYLLVKKIKNNQAVLIFGLIGLFLLATFLIHPRSVFIWKSISILAIIQFPWRFLGLSMFFVSFVGGAIALINIKYAKYVVSILVLATIALNIKYFEPFNYSNNVYDNDKLTGIAWDLQRGSATLDYLPNTAEMAPQSEAPKSPGIITGNGSFANYKVNSNSFSFDAEIYNDAKVNIPVMNFPGWKVISDNKEYEITPYGKLGTISMDLPRGKYIVQGRFEDTPVRTLGNSISLISFLIFLALLCLS